MHCILTSLRYDPYIRPNMHSSRVIFAAAAAALKWKPLYLTKTRLAYLETQFK